MTYVVGSQLQVPNSQSRFHHSTPPGGSVSTGEGGYPDTPGKGLSPLIDSDDEEALRREVEGLDSDGGVPGPLGGGEGPSSSAKMRTNYRKQPLSKPPILRESETCFDGVTSPLVTSQGENSTVVEKTFQHRV
jgi:hypothetical protein